MRSNHRQAVRLRCDRHNQPRLSQAVTWNPVILATSADAGERGTFDNARRHDRPEPSIVYTRAAMVRACGS